MWLHSNYIHLSDLHLLSSFVILQSVTFQSCNMIRHFPVLQIQVTLLNIYTNTVANNNKMPSSGYHSVRCGKL